MIASRLFLATFAAWTGHVQAETPTAKVISLLGKLEAQIKQEGAKEAAEYDKASCYCKDESKNTQYAIETSTTKIALLDANIQKLTAEIDELDGYTKEGETAVAVLGSIQTSANVIENKEAAVTNATSERAEENAAYNSTAHDVADGIESLIAALKDTKADMKDAKLNLLQEKLMNFYSASPVPPTKADLQAVQALVQQVPKSQEKNHAYVFKSNGIIDLLQGLLKGMKEQKNAVNMKEKASLSSYDMNVQALRNEVSFAEKDKREQEALSAEKKADRSAAQTDRDDEQAAMDGDSAYLAEMTSDCESKAAQFDQRSKSRSDEMQAMGEAMTQLKGGISGNYGANNLAAAASFLQLRGGSASGVIAKVADVMSADAQRLHSASLSGLALKLSMGGHFGNVVTLITDLITKLEDEAKAAAASKTDCDDNLKASTLKRDDYKLDLNKGEATIAVKTAEKVRLSSEVQKLAEEMANIQKSVLQATELRTTEKANNERTVEQAKEGAKAVESAMTSLAAYYSGSAFLQGNKGAETPELEASGGATDRSGKSVGDAPKLSYSGDYNGKQDASKGVIGILEVISGDFERTADKTTADESLAASDFEKFETDTAADLADKQKLQKEKEDLIKAASLAINEAKDEGVVTGKLLENALEELEKISAMCLTGEGTFAERAKQREDEITSLQTAMKTLEDWEAL